MRVMVLVKEDEQSESGQLPDEKILTAMTNYVEWLKRATFDGGTGREIRQVFENEDLTTMTPELRKKEDRLREQAAANATR